MYFTFHQRDSRSKMVYFIPTLLLILYTAKNISDSIIPIPPALCDHWNSWPDNVHPPATFYRTCINYSEAKQKSFYFIFLYYPYNLFIVYFTQYYTIWTFIISPSMFLPKFRNDLPSFPCAKGIRELSNLFLDDSSTKEEYLQSKTYNYISDLNGVLIMLKESIFCRKGYKFNQRGVYFSVRQRRECMNFECAVVQLEDPILDLLKWTSW